MNSFCRASTHTNSSTIVAHSVRRAFHFPALFITLAALVKLRKPPSRTVLTACADDPNHHFPARPALAPCGPVQQNFSLVHSKCDSARLRRQATQGSSPRFLLSVSHTSRSRSASGVSRNKEGLSAISGSARRGGASANAAKARGAWGKHGIFEEIGAQDYKMIFA